MHRVARPPLTTKEEPMYGWRREKPSYSVRSPARAGLRNGTRTRTRFRRRQCSACPLSVHSLSVMRQHDGCRCRNRTRHRPRLPLRCRPTPGAAPLATLGSDTDPDQPGQVDIPSPPLGGRLHKPPAVPVVGDATWKGYPTMIGRSRYDLSRLYHRRRRAFS